MRGIKEQALTCQTSGKVLMFTRIRKIQRSFQIEEETKVSESTSFPGRVSSESGIAVWCDIQLQRNPCWRFVGWRFSVGCALVGDGHLWFGAGIPHPQPTSMVSIVQTMYSTLRLVFYQRREGRFWRGMNAGRPWNRTAEHRSPFSGIKDW